MNDIENELYTEIATALRTEFSGIYVTGTYVEKPPKFPCAFIEQMDSFADIMDGGNTEVYTGVMFQVDVFSTKKSGNKTECKSIITFIDAILTEKGFRRTMLNPLPNEDPTVFRMTARYTATISNNIIYRR